MRCDITAFLLASAALLSVSVEARPQENYHVHAHAHGRSHWRRSTHSESPIPVPAGQDGDLKLEKRQAPTWSWTNPFYPKNALASTSTTTKHQTTTTKGTTTKHTTTKHSTTTSHKTTSTKHSTTHTSTSRKTSTKTKSTTPHASSTTHSKTVTTKTTSSSSSRPHSTLTTSKTLSSSSSKPNRSSKPTTSTKPTTKSSSKTSIKTTSKTTAKTTSKATTKTTTKTTSKTTAKTTSKATPKSTTKTTSKTTAKTTPKATTKSTTKSATKTTSRSTTKTTTKASTPTVKANVIRGVNIGNWLVLEKWMDSSLFDGTNAVDQWTFDNCSGAEPLLQNHWQTWFTESDVATIASWGINTMRIPIGYWAYNNVGTPYIKGADAYLGQALGWARTHGLKVLIDVHGSPGSQNGFDNSGHAGTVGWQTGNNMALTTQVLVQIAKKYGTTAWADVLWGIELTNEPISWNQNKLSVTQSWTEDAYAQVKAAATNKKLKVIMHDGFMGAANWAGVNTKLNAKSTLAQSQFVLDLHLYQNQVAADSTLTQAQHIQKACNWSTTELLPASSNFPIIVGEFSLATNICANPDGSTVAGNTCTISGCQCSINVPVEYWSPPLVAATRKFLEAQLDTFEAHSNGWFMWAYKGPGGWGMNNGVQYGLIGAKVTDRMYPNQCKS